MSLEDSLDIEAYFGRIGYGGSHAPTLETLRALHVAHPASIPFENLDPVLGRPVALDAASLTSKLIGSGRGGYCYEQNGLFLRVLSALGFKVAGLAARVLRGHIEPNAPPRSHMLLKVEVEGETFIADVGFGLLTLTAPVRLHETEVQETPHGAVRLRRVADEFELDAQADRDWQVLYRFSLEEQLLQDYEAPNWYRATHPDSPFVRNLMVARPLEDGRLGLLNNQFSIRTNDGELSRHQLISGAEIVEVLEEDFGISLPLPRQEMARALARFVKK
jgi:N-hydroxyarylamine O-acetyltransferase